MFKVITWNVNSINQRLKQLEELLLAQKPDVVMLQETKCSDEKFPHEAVSDLYYNSYVLGQLGGRNGVALLTKRPLEDISRVLLAEDPEARFVEGTFINNHISFKVISVYVPNGREVDSIYFDYKMRFYDALYEYIARHNAADMPLIIGGDFNVAPANIDVYNPRALEGTVCFHIKERQWFKRFEDLGMQDSYRILNPNTQEFSWWDHRGRGFEYGRGMRLDHILVSPSLLKYLKEAYILSEFRGKLKPSDHAPVVLVMEV